MHGIYVAWPLTKQVWHSLYKSSLSLGTLFPWLPVRVEFGKAADLSLKETEVSIPFRFCKPIQPWSPLRLQNTSQKKGELMRDVIPSGPYRYVGDRVLNVTGHLIKPGEIRHLDQQGEENGNPVLIITQNARQFRFAKFPWHVTRKIWQAV